MRLWTMLLRLVIVLGGREGGVKKSVMIEKKIIWYVKSKNHKTKGEQLLLYFHPWKFPYILHKGKNK